MEPVIDSSTGKPARGIRYSHDGKGDSIKNRMWNGYHICDFDGAEERMDRLVTEFKPRDDDVFILAYVKCGTHWLHEICHFLLTQQTSSRPSRKEDFMLECEDLEKIDSYTSPRILNCHIRWSILPASIQSAKKLIYVVRNPKDCAVSMYHHCVAISDYEYSGSFEGFMSLFESGRLDGGSWFEHTRDFVQVMEKAPSNILMVQYELLKRQPKEQIKRIADFLLGPAAASISDQLLDSICDKVSFRSMQADRHTDAAEFFNEKGPTGFYRKGEVGDWKNWLSSEASARIDRLASEALLGVEKLYQPIYE